MWHAERVAMAMVCMSRWHDSTGAANAVAGSTFASSYVVVGSIHAPTPLDAFVERKVFFAVRWQAHQVAPEVLNRVVEDRRSCDWVLGRDPLRDAVRERGRERAEATLDSGSAGAGLRT